MNENITDEQINTLTEMQRDTLGEIGNICMSSSATTLHDILDRRTTITTPTVSITNLEELSHKYNVPYVVVEVSYTQGISGGSILVIKTEDVKRITSMMLGEENPNLDEELSELHLSAIGEVMNQMMGASSTALSSLILREINISPPKVNLINIADEQDLSGFDSNDIISITFIMEVEDLLKTEIVLLMPFEFGKNLINGFLKANNIGDLSEDAVSSNSNKKPHAEERAAAKNNISDNLIKQTDNKQENVRKVEFQSFDTEADVRNQTDNMGLLLDVPLNVTVELGRTKKYLKDILELNVGSIISLDKMAGDLVEILVNGKLIAKGEVVVIDDNFGVRITDIIGLDTK